MMSSAVFRREVHPNKFHIPWTRCDGLCLHMYVDHFLLLSGGMHNDIPIQDLCLLYSLINVIHK